MLFFAVVFIGCSAFPGFVAPKDVIAECGNVPIYEGDSCDLTKIPEGAEFTLQKAECIESIITTRAAYTLKLHTYMTCIKELYDKKKEAISQSPINKQEAKKILICPINSTDDDIKLCSTTIQQETKNTLLFRNYVQEERNINVASAVPAQEAKKILICPIDNTFLHWSLNKKDMNVISYNRIIGV